MDVERKPASSEPVPSRVSDRGFITEKDPWVTPMIDDLGCVTEITLRGTECSSDRTQRGSFKCCCAV